MARSKDFDENEVLAKAVKLFWLKGYNGTSMQDLVDYLGISRSSLYDTYVDKHTLYLKALEYYQHTATQQIADILHSTDSAKKTMRQIFDLTANSLLTDKQHKGCFMLNAEVEVAPQDTEVMNLVCKSERQFEDAIYQTIKKGQKSGEISNNLDARALTHFFANTIKGIRVSVKSTQEKIVFNDIIQTSLSVLDREK